MAPLEVHQSSGPSEPRRVRGCEAIIHASAGDQDCSGPAARVLLVVDFERQQHSHATLCLEHLDATIRQSPGLYQYYAYTVEQWRALLHDGTWSATLGFDLSECTCVSCRPNLPIL